MVILHMSELLKRAPSADLRDVETRKTRGNDALLN